MDFSIYLHALTGLFVIIDPIGAALIFNSLTNNSHAKYRNTMAIKSILISGVTLVLFGNYGEGFFAHLGININSLRISGGLLLFYTAFNMITKSIKDDSVNTEADISVYPMSIPLLAGPGTITLSILLFSHTSNVSESIAVSLAIVSILGLTLFLMIVSKYLKKIIGKTGDEILKRFLGVILAALAIQFVYDGIHNIGL